MEPRPYAGAGVPRTSRDGTGAFHRRHELLALDDHTVVGAIEDDMHCFEVTLRHDGSSVIEATGRAIRWPWTPCADAPGALEALAGLPLSTSSTAVGSWTDAGGQCTHVFDLAGLAVAHAARHVAGGAARRSYLATVPDWFSPPYEAWIQRDGVEVLRFRLGADGIESPEPFTGVSLSNRFIQWCNEHLDDDTTEAALLLRRAAWMSPARHLDLEAAATASDSMLKPGVCFTSQPQRLAIAYRNRNSLRDYGTRPDEMLSDFPR
jgi:hypothetical protein